MPHALRVNDLGKCYRINHAVVRGVSSYRTLRDELSRLATLPVRWLRRGSIPDGRVEDFWALREVSFDVEPGEVIGVIGRNGAGKSTLLKILSRITKPTTGRVELRGRVGSLLEVGTGFHPELTGRENIYLNGAILGMPRAQIRARFDEIVDFAGVEKFLDTPVKRYSSGMYVRLAFAVAAYLKTDLLLVDEVLAVGDSNFQKKCLGRMQDLSTSGRTVFFVSHSMPAVRSLTQRCLYLQNGRIVFDGPTPEAIDAYLNDAWSRPATGEATALDYYRRDRASGKAVRLERLWFTGSDGVETRHLRSGETFTIHGQLHSDAYEGDLCVAFWLVNQQSERVATFFSGDQGYRPHMRPGTRTLSVRVDSLPLAPGRYTLSIGINKNAHDVAFDVIVDYPAFEVQLPELDSGQIEWPQRPWGCILWDRVTWCEDSP
jgi:ABC-type polysaccharide/polyol phosphate transport system ATPase subunit